MKRAIVSCLLVAASALFAAVDWPADFEANLAAHIAATSPSGSAIGTLDRTDQDLSGCSVVEISAGTALLPIDYMSVSWYWSNWINLNSNPPTGFGIFIR